MEQSEHRDFSNRASGIVDDAMRAASMGLLQMSGSYPLTDASIDEVITRKSPGNYALGYADGDTFHVFYVGRSDWDLGGQLHEWVDRPSQNERNASPAKAPWRLRNRERLPVGTAAPGRVSSADDTYTRFAYSYARSADEAYAKEWRNYDDFGGSPRLDNATPPASPDCQGG